MAHAIFRSDLMSGTKQPADLVSVKVSTATDNGFLVKVGALVSGEREVYAATAPAVTDTLDSLVILGTPEVMYDGRKKNLNEFTNEANSVARGYRLRSGNVFSVTAEALDGTATVGKTVEVTTTKMKVATSVTDGSTQVGTVIAIEGDYVVIRVV